MRGRCEAISLDEKIAREWGDSIGQENAEKMEQLDWTREKNVKKTGRFDLRKDKAIRLDEKIVRRTGRFDVRKTKQLDEKIIIKGGDLIG